MVWYYHDLLFIFFFLKTLKNTKLKIFKANINAKLNEYRDNYTTEKKTTVGIMGIVKNHDSEEHETLEENGTSLTKNVSQADELIPVSAKCIL